MLQTRNSVLLYFTFQNKSSWAIERLADKTFTDKKWI